MDVEQVINFVVAIAPWLAALLLWAANRGAFAKLEDVSGCNGDVRVSFDKDGRLILRGPCEMVLEVSNWRLD